jgi:2-iminobutanoate/2-iminopropanoate deaminase
VKTWLSMVLVGVMIGCILPARAQTSTKAKRSGGGAVRFSNPSGLAKPLSTYSQVAEVTGGKLIFVAGQVGVDGDGKLVSKDDFRAQVEQVFKNIKAAVEASGGSMNTLVKTNYYVSEAVDPKEFPALREIRDRYINTQAPPTSTFVVVKRLASPDYLIEVEAVAAVK